MKDPLKPRDKITQKMTRDGAIAENQTTGDTERISKRTQDADFQKSPEQQAAQDAAQLQGAASPTSPLPKSISRNPTKPLTDWIRQRQLSPKKRNLRKSAPLTKPPGKARPACTLRKRTSRPDLRTNTAPYPAPHRKPGFWYTTRYIPLKRTIPAWRERINPRN